ncbi:MAG: hypothetical protein K0R33_3642 [Mycobacterium sp.]|jgi:hypothetical protein|nr:hypothetical protein [Mycobacterium sp.]
MTATKRRFAAASLATLMPLAAISIATAAPGVAETTCSGGQVSFNGSCVDQCKSSQVRNSATGECQTLLAAALEKAETPAVAKLTPEQLGGAWQMANNIGAIPEASRAVGMTMNIVDTAVDIPVAASSAAADLALTLAYLQGAGISLPNGLRAATGGAQAFSAAGDIAQVARALPSPQIGLPKLPKIGLPAPPKIGFPKIGMPRIGPPKLGASGICGPKLLFFTPCL